MAAVAARNDDDTGNKRVKVANPANQVSGEISAQISDMSDADESSEVASGSREKAGTSTAPNNIKPQQQQPQEPPTHGKDDSPLRRFVLAHAQSLKCAPDTFYDWLQGMDIATISDLHEACGDSDFVDSSMIGEGGLKKFKRGPFVKAVQAAAQSPSSFNAV